MIEALLQQRYYVAAVVLFSIGFVTLCSCTPISSKRSSA